MKKAVVQVALIALVVLAGCSNPSGGGDAGPPVVAAYGISLSQSGTVTFPAAVVGYTAAPAAQSVTVSNTGNRETGELTAALSGDNDSDFTLSGTPISSIAVDGNNTFTVVPNIELAAGTYTATVTVSGDNGITANFTVSFTVNAAVYSISLNPSGPLTFTIAHDGYAAPETKTITVSNTGNQETGELTVTLSDASFFELSKTSINTIAVNGNDTFTVVPNMGLAAGTYTATVTVSGANGIIANFEVSFTVVPAPITETVKGVSYTLKGIPGGTVNVDVVYSGGLGGPFMNAATVNVPISAFYMGETEVTYELWKVVYDWATHTDRGANQYIFANPGQQGGQYSSTGPVGTNQHPVTIISWRDAVVWCNAYSEAAGKTPVYYLAGTSDFSDSTKVLRESEGSNVSAESGKAELAVLDPNAGGFRLPTNAQWEYAARGGVPSTGTPWTYTYAGSNATGNVAVYIYNSGNKTAAVKSLPGGNYNGANSLGLYDMSGNVWEWCQNVYWNARVVRGGSWYGDAPYCAVAYWETNDPASADYSRGFRPVAHP
jgi:formylglycine-generating enzyme required for sulfatase activity/methionine-rich copper-binding protein CopC